MKNLGEAISLDDIISDPRININITRCRSTMRGTPSVAPAGAKLYDNLPSSPAVTFLSRISDPGSAEPSAVSSLRIGDRIGDYLVGQKIAETGFSTVYAANHVCTASDGDDCAPESYSFVVKAISQDASPMGVPMSKIIRNELYMWSTLCHENIVRMVDYMISKNDVFIVSEFMEGGNMLDFLNRSPCRLVEPEAKRIFRMITSGLHYLHSVARVFHGDLKLENILLSRDGYIKISDFGLTSAVSLDPRGSSDSHFSYPAAVDSFFGSIVYCPPEVICGLRVVGGIEFDIWSLGCILYALATGVLPFKDMLLPRLKDSIANAAYDKSLLSESGASKELVAQIDLILQVDPQKRPNTHQIIAGPWLRLSRPSQPRGSPGRSKRDTPRNCDYK